MIINEVLKNTINDLVVEGKGILAADESTGTIGKRLATINVESTEENRRLYRETLFTTEGLNEFVSGVIMFEETLGQSTSDGVPFAELLSRQGIVPGIKVDKGLVKIKEGGEENVTQGLDGLTARLKTYKEQGARFAKWRAVFHITQSTPTVLAIELNAHNLARYAYICQSQDIVPIVEPELLMEGTHSIEECAEVTEEILHRVFHALHRQHVSLEHMVLKPNMVIPGTDHQPQADPMAIANATIRALKHAVPAAVPSINFLSGGQSAKEATVNLSTINAVVSHKPWHLSFSYGRALQEPTLKAWAGDENNRQLAQTALLKRVKLNSAAVQGEYTEMMEGDF